MKTEERINEAVYVAFTAGLFYYAAKYWINTDAMAALLIGTAIGKIISLDNSKINDHV